MRFMWPGRTAPAIFLKTGVNHYNESLSSKSVKGVHLYLAVLMDKFGQHRLVEGVTFAKCLPVQRSFINRVGLNIDGQGQTTVSLSPLSTMKTYWPVILIVGIVSMTGVVGAQTLTDIGTASPTPGPNDISQLSTNGNTAATTSTGRPDGLNYYSNNSSPPGQTFTTGQNSTNLISLAVRTAGLDSGGGYGTPSTITNYYLRIYSVSGTTANLIQAFTNRNPGFTDGQWLKWNNLSVTLAPNSTYAYSVSTLPGSSSSWVALAVASGNAYPGGQVALIPIAGGSLTFGSPTAYDAVFDLGMFANAPTANTPVAAPASTVYVGQLVTLTESALGTGTLYYQWQTDGGGGGGLTNIPGATGTQVTVNVSTAGIYNYNIIVTNNYGSETSRVAAVTVQLPVSVTLNVSNTMATMPLQGLGVCTAVYDNVLINYPSIAAQLKAVGIGALRFPGGSYADVYCWTNNSGIDGAYVNSNDGFDNFMNDMVNPADAQAIITVNYGSNPSNNNGGDTNVAAAWVNYANNVKHWGVKYWEIGNEVGGNGYYSGQDWEYDLHYPETNAATRVGQSALSPAAYGTNAVQFISAMKAQDPTISCGIGFAPGNNAYNTPLLKAVGTNADFVIIHWYPGSDTASTLAASATIPSTLNSTYSELTNILGASRASQMKVAVTETGAGGAVGASASLYAADNYLTWIENGVVNVDYQILHTDILQNNQTPGHAYYGAMMSHLLAGVGDKFLKTTSALGELRVHATTRQDGKTGVMLVNMDPLLTIPATMTISGTNLASKGILYQFGLTNFIGANDYPGYSVYSNTVSGLGNVFTVFVPPYTIIDVLIPPALPNTPPVLSPIGDQTVNVGQTVAFTAGATDTDQPPQILTFNLLTGSVSATLNTNSGVFSWRPQVTDADTTNPFTIKVADNGSPGLSATQNFTITVNSLTQPGLSSFGLNGELMGFQITGETGPDYAVLGSSNMINWNLLFITNSPSMPFYWTDSNTAAIPAQFYRIKVGPPLP